MDVDIAPVVDKSIPLHKFYAALGHAIRYDIIRYLGSYHRPVQYTELVKWLQIKPGSFYFHVKKLSQLIAQDNEKRFYLTPMGQIAFGLIRSGETVRHDDQKPEDQDQPSIHHPPKRFSTIFFGEFIRRRAFTRQFNVIVVVVILGQIFLLDLAKLGMIPFYLDGNLYFGLLGCVGEYIASILAIWLCLEFITRYFSIKGISRELLSGIPLALLPLFLYPTLVILSGKVLILSTFLANPTVSILLIFFLQILTAVFVIQLLQVIKTVNFERALVPVFIILYGFSIVSLVISTIL